MDAAKEGVDTVGVTAEQVGDLMVFPFIGRVFNDKLQH